MDMWGAQLGVVSKVELKLTNGIENERSKQQSR